MNDAGVKSALRVLDLLELLAAITRPMGVSEIARRLSAPKSSTQALLTTLATRGYIERSGTEYFLSPALRAHGWAGGPYAELRRVARPVMEVMVARSGESSFLAIATADWQVQYVDKVVSPNPVRYDADTVSARPTHATSAGIVILAHRDEKEREHYLAEAALAALTPHTIVARDALRAAFDSARANGYAEVVDAHVPGASGASAPIFDAAGKVIGAVNLGAPTHRYIEQRAQICEHVTWGASEITRMLRRSAPNSRAA